MIRSNAFRLTLPLLFAALAVAGCKREQPQPAPEPATPDATAASPAQEPVASANVEFPTLKVTTIDGKAWDLASQRADVGFRTAGKTLLKEQTLG